MVPADEQRQCRARQPCHNQQKEKTMTMTEKKIIDGAASALAALFTMLVESLDAFVS